MIPFGAYLTELFNKPAPWRRMIDSNHTKVYKSKLPSGNDLKVSMYNPSADYWSISFDVAVKGKYAEYSLTGSKEEFTVFSTVIDIIEDFVKQVEPKVFSFGASDSSVKMKDLESEDPRFVGKNRSRLYERMVKRFASRIKYRVKIDPSTFETEFIFTRK